MRRQRNKGGRPNVLGVGATYVTVKLTAAQLRAVNHIAGPAPGRRPAAMRQLLDVGIKAAKAARGKR
jgi:hypothetical protein